MVYTYIRILFSPKKGNSVVDDHMDEPENIILSEMSLSQKAQHCMIPLRWGDWNGPQHAIKEWNGGC